MGSIWFLQTPILHPLLPITSHSSSHSFLLKSHIKNDKKRRTTIIMSASSNPNEIGVCKRKVILFLGVAAIPFLQLKARAVETSVKGEERGSRTLEDNQSIEQIQQEEVPSNPLLSLFNVVGIISSGVLGALYSLAQKEKTGKESTIESLKNILVEKDTAVVSRAKNFEERLLKEQEERARINKKAKEEQTSFSNQLNTTNNSIGLLRKELQSEKRLVGELKTDIDKLQNGLAKAGEENKVLEAKLKAKRDSIEALQDRINLLTLEIKDKESKLQSLNSSLEEKELEYTNLSFIHKRAKDDLNEVSSEIKSLKEELLKTQKDLNSKKSSVDDLNMKLTSLITERDHMNRKLETLQEAYNDLKSSTEKKAASDAELLGKREHELHQLEEKIKFALNEASKNKKVTGDLTHERDGLKTLLAVEVDNAKNLRHELEIRQETLQASRNEVSDLSEQLRKSRRTCEELASEVSRVQTEFVGARESLMVSLDEARSKSEVLSGELASVRKDLEKTKEELLVVSRELAVETDSRDSLKKELVDVYKKAESASHDLKEERNMVATLYKELEDAKKQIVDDKEARKTIETDLEDATKSLDEVNKKVLMLSRELDMTNPRVESLEVEKDMLYKSLMEQKNLSKEAHENIEDAHDIIMKLGKEREKLDKRGKKLEEELASAKGEILRLRSKKNLSRSSENALPKKKNNEIENDAPMKKNNEIENDTPKKRNTGVENDVVITVKKTGRRRKSTGSSSEALE
ncbi:hypothetical protein IFM89_022103 [Coptis chinensis]|uniref:MAR-binding filament-like protein 1-1 n=1 Tax=Coptis chinensis TaxID=261450 RepID=A0A835M165_9MAGN|nr:hypothetical protein IFM89_022103 [Coptis chinensis]